MLLVADPAVLYPHGAGVDLQYMKVQVAGSATNNITCTEDQHQHHEGTGLQDLQPTIHGAGVDLQYMMLLVADPAVLYLHGAGVDLQYMLCCWLQILQSCTLMVLVLIFST